MGNKDRLNLDLDFLEKDAPAPEKPKESEHKNKEPEHLKSGVSAESEKEYPKKPIEEVEATPKEKRNQVWAGIGIAAFIIILAVVGVTSEKKKIEYVTSGPGVYLLPKGAFALHFPDKPNFEVKSQALLSAEETPYSTENYDYESPDSNYFITATHIPNAFTNSQSATPEENMRKQLAYTGNNWGNKIISSTASTYKGYPSVDFVATTGNGKMNYIGKDVLVGNHLYMIGYYYDPTKVTEDKNLEKKIFESIDFYDPADYPEARSITYPSVSVTNQCGVGLTFDKDANKCVTSLQYCKNRSGSHATYTASDNTCGCAAGYLIDANNQCVYVPPAKTGYQVCAEDHATWDGLSYTDSGGFSCTCMSGYNVSADGNTCVIAPVKSGYQVCRDQYSNATWDGLSYTDSGGYQCSCAIGYEWNSATNSCY